MPSMLSPYSRKPVDVPDGLVDRFRGAGFKEQEPEAVESVEAESAPEAKPAPRRGRPRNTRKS